MPLAGRRAPVGSEARKLAEAQHVEYYCMTEEEGDEEGMEVLREWEEEEAQCDEWSGVMTMMGWDLTVEERFPYRRRDEQ